MCANSLRRTHKLSKATTLVDAFEDVCTMDAPLNERLAAFSDTLRELNFPFAEAYDDLFARLYSGDVGTTAPAVGEPAHAAVHASGT